MTAAEPTPTGKRITEVRRGECDTVWGATASTPRNPTLPLTPKVLGLLKKDKHTLVVLQRSIASRTNGRDRLQEWIAGKNVDASIAEIPATGRQCHGQARAGYIFKHVFSRKIQY